MSVNFTDSSRINPNSDQLAAVAFDRFDLSYDGERLSAEIEGVPVESLAKEIKAVTYHNLAVRETARGLEATIVFDV